MKKILSVLVLLTLSISSLAANYTAEHQENIEAVMKAPSCAKVGGIKKFRKEQPYLKSGKNSSGAGKEVN